MSEFNDADLKELAEFVTRTVTKETGVQFLPRNVDTVKMRLTHRLAELNFNTTAQYKKFLQDDEGEMRRIVSLLTVHHTYFFREFSHFELIQEKLFLKMVARAKADGDGKIKIASLGCSKGHEVYSLAMFIDYLLDLHKITSIDYEVHGVDISEDCILFAEEAKYNWDDISKSPSMYVEKYFDKGTRDQSGSGFVKQKIRDKCRFERGNLMKLPGFVKDSKYDLIFCRNVLIYFEHVDIQNIVNSFKNILHPEAHFFLGLSESLSHLEMPQVIGINYSGYCFKCTEANIAEEMKFERDRIRVLCVDDSQTILSMLTKIFEDDRYQLVGTAKNGQEAADFLRTNSVDVITLDLHMPVKDGIEFLEKDYRRGPPVIIISTVSRHDAHYAMKAFELGAMDYVEKPTLTNFASLREEIQIKVTSAYLLNKLQLNMVHDLSKYNRSTLEVVNPHDYLGVMLAEIRDLEKLRYIFREYKDEYPPLLVMLNSNEHLTEETLKSLQGEFDIKAYENPIITKEELSKHRLWFMHFNVSTLGAIRRNSTFERLVFMHLGIPSEKYLEHLRPDKNLDFILEDMAISDVHSYEKAKSVASHILPHTSFTYDFIHLVHQHEEEERKNKVKKDLKIFECIGHGKEKRMRLSYPEFIVVLADLMEEEVMLKYFAIDSFFTFEKAEKVLFDLAEQHNKKDFQVKILCTDAKVMEKITRSLEKKQGLTVLSRLCHNQELDVTVNGTTGEISYVILDAKKTG